MALTGENLDTGFRYIGFGVAFVLPISSTIWINVDMERTKKMRNLQFILLFAVCLMGSKSFCDDIWYNRYDTGLSVPPEAYQNSLIVNESSKGQLAIRATIAKFNPAAAQDLSRKIRIVSSCFGIDTFVFTGLVQQESQFKPSWFGINGVGLTQMTSTGIKEVNQQLDFCPGKSNCSDPDARAAILKIVKTCVAPNLEKFFAGSSKKFEDFGAKELGRWTVRDEDINLVYGAILLKAKIWENSQRMNWENVSDASAIEIYRQALRDYNGNVQPSGRRGLQVRDTYATAVIGYVKQIQTRAAALANSVESDQVASDSNALLEPGAATAL